MKQLVPHTPALVILLSCPLLFSLSSCSKIRGHLPSPPADTAQLCRIQSIYADPSGTQFGGTPFTVSYTYDAKGNPATQTTTGGTEYFRYDPHGRLSDVIQHPRATAGYDGWTSYTYPSAALVIDSVYISPSDTSNPNAPTHPGDLYYVENISLDTKGRAIQIVRTFPGNTYPPSTTAYDYDSAGNRQRSFCRNCITYDNRINIYRTSPVWQLLNLDYSRNNPKGPFEGPTAYNSIGLPTHLIGPGADPAFGYYYGNMDVTYTCDVSGPAPAK